MIVGTRCGGCGSSQLSSSKVMIASDRRVRQAGTARAARADNGAEFIGQERIYGPIPQPSMSKQSSAPIQEKLGVVAAWVRSVDSAPSGCT